MNLEHSPSSFDALQSPMPRRKAITMVSSMLVGLPFLKTLVISRQAFAAVPWATGGTGAMKGGYPDPFAQGIGNTCTLYKASTPGPCHALTVDRRDVSEGEDGLPVRLSLLILDHQCQPVPGATVEIWHTSPAGLYSGNDAARMCTQGNAKAEAARWFRGIQTADEKGRVDFDTCYPGWYGGRAVHIHFTVRANGKEYLTSQFFFDDALNTEIFTSHPVYKNRGDVETKNSEDMVIQHSKLTNHILQTQKMEDGALLAWKTVVITA